MQVYVTDQGIQYRCQPVSELTYVCGRCGLGSFHIQPSVLMSQSESQCFHCGSILHSIILDHCDVWNRPAVDAEGLPTEPHARLRAMYPPGLDERLEICRAEMALTVAELADRPKPVALLEGDRLICAQCGGQIQSLDDDRAFCLDCDWDNLEPLGEEGFPF